MYFSVDSASEMKYDLVMDLSWAPVLLDPFILFNILHEAPEVTIEKKRCSWLIGWLTVRWNRILTAFEKLSNIKTIND